VGADNLSTSGVLDVVVDQPPRRSTRRTRTLAAGAGGGTAPCGGAWSSARWGRCWL